MDSVFQREERELPELPLEAEGCGLYSTKIEPKMHQLALGLLTWTGFPSLDVVREELSVECAGKSSHLLPGFDIYCSPVIVYT